MAQFILIDYLFAGVIVLSVLIGLWRGFLSEFIALASWVAAFVVAYWFARDVGAYLEPYIAVPTARQVIAFGGLFLVTLLLGGMVNILITQLVRRTGLSGTDRLIGLVFGGVRGAALVSVLLLLATLTPLPQDDWWRESTLIPYFEPFAMWLRTLLPQEFGELFVFPGETPPVSTESPALPQVVPPDAVAPEPQVD